MFTYLIGNRSSVRLLGFAATLLISGNQSCLAESEASSQCTSTATSQNGSEGMLDAGTSVAGLEGGSEAVRSAGSSQATSQGTSEAPAFFVGNYASHPDTPIPSGIPPYLNPPPPKSNYIEGRVQMTEYVNDDQPSSNYVTSGSAGNN